MDEIRLILEELRKDVSILKDMYKVDVEPTKKGMCEGVTGKGTPCKNGSVDGEKFCRMHGREKKEVPKTRVKKEVKPKKIQPEHTHLLGEIPENPCPLCETHGDVMDPTLSGATFEGDDITERLRRLLESENDVCV
tara:strand:+ start:2342 stop:2749 length:408 start_codon:yes stop_codon:yes gene_type:complete